MTINGHKTWVDNDRLMIQIEALIPYERNPRHNDCAVDAVRISIERYGQQQPIIVDENGVIVVGHTRYKALNTIKEQHVWIQPAMKNGRWLSEDECRAYRIADNKTGELATWDAAMLSVELDEIECDLDYLEFDEIGEIEANDPYEEFEDFPLDYTSENKKEIQKIILHIWEDSERDKLAELINQKITEKTKYINLPRQKKPYENEE